MSRDDRFASAIVRHVCGVRGVSAKVAVVRAQRVWCTVRKSTDDRVDGGNEEKHRSVDPKQMLQCYSKRSQITHVIIILHI